MDLRFIVWQLRIQRPQHCRLFHVLGADVMFELQAGAAPVCHVLEVVAWQTPSYLIVCVVNTDGLQVNVNPSMTCESEADREVSYTNEWCTHVRSCCCRSSCSCWWTRSRPPLVPGNAPQLLSSWYELRRFGNTSEILRCRTGKHLNIQFYRILCAFIDFESCVAGI